MESIEKKLKQLSPELQAEVRDFIDFLLKRSKRRPGKRLKLDWAGGLREYRDKYTSLELQKKALEWRD